MARLLFIENREKTYFWAAIARRLAARGHEVAWLVQNPWFARDLPGRVRLIPFPRRRDLDPAADAANFPALVTDRGREHFDAGSAHYGYYAQAIADAIDAEVPDIVIGEPTLFHELLAVAHCARRGITFAHPVGERYPPGRFAIFDGWSQRPLVESGEPLDEDIALDLATRIQAGRALPTYMVGGGAWERRRRYAMWAATRGRVVAGRWAGERFNTPSVARKAALSRRAAANGRSWRAAEQVPRNPARAVMYPLQMQPENTIDVWGRPDWDQAGIVGRMLDATPGDVEVVVKANPKPYYELSDALLALAATEPRVVLLPFAMRMAEAMTHVAGAVTVTGTVGYEAVCGRGRCLSTAHPVLDDHFPAFAAPSIETAASRLLDDPDAGRGSAAEGARLMQVLTRRSFVGTISDPVSDPPSMAADNIRHCADGIDAAISQLTRLPARSAVTVA